MLNRHLAVTLVNSIKETKEHFDNNKMWNLEQVFSSTTVREFDSRFTSKMFGYKDVMEYYADCRLYDKLGKIKVKNRESCKRVELVLLHIKEW